jgi:hypothetical protein
MNATNITRYQIPIANDAWHRFRTIGLTPLDCEQFKCSPYDGGIGASEIGNLLGLTKKYRPCPAEVFHYKVGTAMPSQIANRAMLRGKILEPIVKDIWSLYNGEDDAWVPVMEDYREGDRATRDMLSIRKATKRNAYFVNGDFPWLFSSLDYFAEKNTAGILDGKIHTEGFPVEVKTINQNYAKLWEAGCPPYHVCQLNQEMICTNSNYGEIAVLFPDDFSFRIFPFYRDEELCQRIIDYSKEWWGKVLESREAKKQMDKFYQLGQMEKGEEMQAIIDSNEPEPDDGEAYLAYIKERFQPGAIESIEGEIPLYYETLEYKLAAEISGLLDDKQRGIKNRILKILETSGAQKIDFGGMGKITFNADKNGNRTLRVDTKPLMPLQDRADKEYLKIDFNLK